MSLLSAPSAKLSDITEEDGPAGQKFRRWTSQIHETRNTTRGCQQAGMCDKRGDLQQEELGRGVAVEDSG